MTRRAELILMTLAALFIALHSFSPFAANKIIDFYGVTFAASSLISSITYVFLDVINDWRGKKEAKILVEATIITRAILYFVVIPIILFLPTKSITPGFEEVMTVGVRLGLASFVAMFVGTWLFNINAFTWLKEKMEGKNFILRYMLTIVPTLLITATIYNIVGFWGTDKDISALIFGTIVVRIFMSWFWTPLAWVLRRGVRYA